MTVRRPLVQINGELKELPVGDTIAGAGAGGTQEVFVQDADPGLPNGVPALWVQTNVGGDPTKFSLWFNT